MSKPEEVDDLLKLNEDELLTEVGRALASRDAGARQPTEGELFDRGDRWWNGFIAKLCSFVCQHRDRLAELQGTDERLFVLTVADLVSSATLGVPPFVVGALFLRIGIKRICPQPASAK